MKIDKRGFAIETALAIMLIALALCALTITLCLSCRSVSANADKAFETQTEIESIGARFSNAPETFVCTEVGYRSEVSVDRRTMRLFDDSDTLLLTVELDSTGAIIRWQR